VSTNKCAQWQQHWDRAQDVLQLLTQFAFYCGTGHHTTVGLGQTRVVEPRARLPVKFQHTFFNLENR
jgi:hypothetical protein